MPLRHGHGTQTIQNNCLSIRFQFLLLDNITIYFPKYSVMIGWEFFSLISESNLIGCIIYLILSTNNFTKFLAFFKSALLFSGLLQVTVAVRHGKMR